MAATAAAALAALGLVTGAGGAYLKGQAGDITRKRLEDIANTPGLDIEGLSSLALANQQRLLPGASKLTHDEALARQQTLNELIESSMPGFTASRNQAQGIADSLLAGEIPQEVQDAVQRSAAARALGGGYGGSQMHGNLVGRDIGQAGMGLQAKGLEWLSALRGLSPTVTPQSAFSFTGPDANQFLNIRGQERAQSMDLRAKAAGIPGQTAAWADWMTQTGGIMTGIGTQGFAGAGGFGGGGSGFAGSSGSPGQTVGNAGGFVPYSGTYYAQGSRPYGG